MTGVLAGGLYPTVSAILVLAGIGIAVSAAEDLRSADLFSDKGLLSWQVLKWTKPAPRMPLLRKSRDALFAPRGYVAQIAVKAATGAGLIFTVLIEPPHGDAILGGLCAVALASILLLQRRSGSFGLDGSDDMMVVTLLACTVFFMSPTGSTAQVAALLYIATQAVLSYVVAGVAKALSPQWRSGRAIVGILGTHIYGYPPVATLLRGHHLIAVAMCWAVITFECGFVVVPFLPDQQGALAALLLGALFHASTAVLMGLNGFLWAFTATYPAILFANQLLTGYV